MNVSAARLFAVLALGALGTACSSAPPSDATPVNGPSETAEPEKTCDVLHASFTFDGPASDGTHPHGACDACLQANCCEDMMSCFEGDPSCPDLGACLMHCGDNDALSYNPKGFYECRTACYAAHRSVEALFDRTVACRTGTCKAVCGG